MHISNSQSRVKRQPVAEHPAPRLRSYSLDSNNNHRPVHLPEQLKNTFEFKQKGFKGNTRGGYIHEPFLTLDDVLSQTPDSVALNMEIKYPMLSEAADDWKSDVLAMEINIFVDTVLSTILSHHSWHSRPIILSSFNPDVCILLSIKQTLFPVLFLNDSGNTPTGDIRASCLQEAIRFATTWGLDGIVMASEPFVFAPRLIQVAQGRGLVTGSYGALNDEPENAKVSIFSLSCCLRFSSYLQEEIFPDNLYTRYKLLQD
ncbi:Glycerophosphoryl diester phosphodiesterase family-domain-containing protein [Aspergillus varians]